MRAAIYARYSAGSEQTFQSIEGQVRECKKYIKNKGWTFTSLFADEHITGRTDKRPEFQKMLNAAEDHAFDALVVYTTDRFSRDKYDSVMYKRKLRLLGIQIHYAAENIPEGPEGILLESLMEGWAEYYSAELSRKVKRGMHDTATKAHVNGGVPILGYKKGEDKKYIIVESEAVAVKKIFEMIYSGKTIVSAVEYLNNSGFRNGQGRKYNSHSVRRLLSNKKYIGQYKYADVVIEDGIPAIIDRELFFAVQEVLAMNTTRPKTKSKYLLTGKLFCGICGEPMSGATGTSKTGAKYRYYRCRHNNDINPIEKDELERIVVDETRKLFMAPEKLDMLAEKLISYQQRKNAIESDISDLETNLGKLKLKQEKLLDLIAETGDKRLIKKLDDIDYEVALVEAEINKIKKQAKGHLFTKEEMRLSLEIYFKGFDWDTTEKTSKRIIDALVSRVELYPEEILLFYNIMGPDGEPIKVDHTSSSELALTPPYQQLGELFITPGGFVCIKIKLHEKRPLKS